MLEYSGFLTLDIRYFILITFGARINRKSSIDGFPQISLSGATGLDHREPLLLCNSFLNSRVVYFKVNAVAF